jgi:hypothetical protein
MNRPLLIAITLALSTPALALGGRLDNSPMTPYRTRILEACYFLALAEVPLVANEKAWRTEYRDRQSAACYDQAPLSVDE